MKQQTHAAFLSYVHEDDKYGQITKLREHLSDEVRMALGTEFPIFQDRQDIYWGQVWQQRLEGSLDEVTFLIPVITPSFFNSPHCRNELQRFFDREKELSRNDLILPVYFVDTPLLNEDELRATDVLAQAIASRQYADWRELRFEPFTKPQVGKTLERFARQIRDALPRVKPLRALPAARGAAVEPQSTNPPMKETSEEATHRPSAKNEPPTCTVNLWPHRGDFTTISDAIEKSEPGTKIIVQPGFYEEGLVINKPLEIIGEGEVVVQALGKSVILFQTTMGRVANLTLRQAGGGKWFAVDIAQGRLELEDCDITSQGSTCIAIHSGADPRLRRNRIHDGKQTGVYIYESGLGTLEDNDIFGNDYAGVQVVRESNPTLRNNRIKKNGFQAVVVHAGGGGTFEGNDLRDNPRGAWYIEATSKAKVKRSNNQE